MRFSANATRPSLTYFASDFNYLVIAVRVWFWSKLTSLKFISLKSISFWKFIRFEKCILIPPSSCQHV